MADQTTSTLVPVTRSPMARFAQIRRKYEISLAKLKLELAEADDSDDDAIDAAIDRFDDRDRKFCLAIRKSKPPTRLEELLELIQIMRLRNNQYDGPSTPAERKRPRKVCVVKRRLPERNGAKWSGGGRSTLGGN